MCQNYVNANDVFNDEIYLQKSEFNSDIESDSAVECRTLDWENPVTNRLLKKYYARGSILL